MKEVDAEKIDKLIDELKDCELKSFKEFAPIGMDERCAIEVILSHLKTERDIKLLEEYAEEVEEWERIRPADSSFDEKYALWLGHEDAATEITSENGEYEVCDYASIVGLDFPKKLEKKTPFLKTCTSVRAPNIKAAFVRGTRKLSEYGGEEEFVEELPTPGD